MTDINYHFELHGKSAENFRTLVDLQILVKDCANTRYNTNTRYKYNLKSLLNNLLNISGEWGASNCIF